MKRLLFLPLLLVSVMVSAKSGNIPSYTSFVYWIQGVDTLYDEGNNILLESSSPDGTVTVRVRHEEWDNVVSERRQQLIQPWHSAMSASKGIRAIIHQGKSNTDALMITPRSPKTTPAIVAVEQLSKLTDQLDMNLNAQYMVENTSNREIVVNDLNRGLVWYVRPKSYLIFNAGSLPYACLLRIANTDPLQPSVKYVTIGSASFSKKHTIAYEDEECWIYTAGQEVTYRSYENDFTGILGLQDRGVRSVYIRLDKNTFMESDLSENEVMEKIRKAKGK